MGEAKAVLICSVGGTPQPIIKAIEKVRPNYVYFVCSKDDPASGTKGSYTQVDGILDKTDLKKGCCDIIKVSPDNLDNVCRSVLNEIRKSHPKGTKVVVDYTGGTKTMSAGLVVLALEEDWQLNLVTGMRSNLEKIKSGEYARPAAVEEIRFLRSLNSALRTWERFAYEEAVFLLESVSPPREEKLKGKYEQVKEISFAFSAWDRFDHCEAKRRLSPFKKILGKDWGVSVFRTLESLLDKEKGGMWKIFDLWNNAQRRAHQGRYDDAVSRLYRLVEWAAQWILRSKYEVDTKDVPEGKIPPGLELASTDGKKRAGLVEAWEIVAYLDCGVLKEFWGSEKKRILHFLEVRNSSLLAHGFKPVSKEDWEKFSDYVEKKFLPMLKEFFKIRTIPPQLPTSFPMGSLE
ncbi:MAG: TIGR02710 family CRISPR-associated protein [Planctomycetota bacterium]|nr:MAG: TIGR02710 family CRISPR-associated protein [Planctomycetota bacterium]